MTKENFWANRLQLCKLCNFSTNFCATAGASSTFKHFQALSSRQQLQKHASKVIITMHYSATTFKLLLFNPNFAGIQQFMIQFYQFPILTHDSWVLQRIYISFGQGLFGQHWYIGLHSTVYNVQESIKDKVNANVILDMFMMTMMIFENCEEKYIFFASPAGRWSLQNMPRLSYLSSALHCVYVCATLLFIGKSLLCAKYFSPNGVSHILFTSLLPHPTLFDTGSTLLWDRRAKEGVKKPPCLCNTISFWILLSFCEHRDSNVVQEGDLRCILPFVGGRKTKFALKTTLIVF